MIAKPMMALLPFAPLMLQRQQLLMNLFFGILVDQKVIARLQLIALSLPILTHHDDRSRNCGLFRL
jgi:hypothetical protein